MSASEALLDSDLVDSEDDFQYRPLSTAAIASVVFGLVFFADFLSG